MIINAKSQRGIIILGGIAAAFFIIGILIGHFSTKSSSSSADPVEQSEAELVENLPAQIGTPERQEQPRETVVEINNPYEDLIQDKWINENGLIQTIMDRIDSKNIKEYHRYFTAEPHLAATERDEELAYYIQDRFKEFGFDVSELFTYNVLLTKPDPSNPNKVTIMDGDNPIFISNHMEEAIHPNDSNPNFVHAFNAFTPAGTVTTSPGMGLVYVNYGTLEDFDQLTELGINITGHIAIVRYGKIYRGNKIRHAQDAGATGIILYSDPEDVAAEGISDSDVYDNTWWLPGTGMQRGSTFLGEGDPLTPGWPSTKHAFRIEPEDADMHKIPAQPIGYADALRFMELMDGDEAPEEWKGGMPNITYKLGPMFLPNYSRYTVTLSTHNMDNVTRSFNVMGIIKGSIEPDRYVMIGNHRDAWGYGGADPSSGTAQMIETARVFGTLLSEGWRPRRSIVFNSWGAEEYGLIGSKEFVEEYVDKLQARGVGYVNTDTCASGPILHVGATPLMHDIILNITTMVPGVVDPSKTLHDEWSEYALRKNPNASAENVPEIGGLGGGSDHAHFAYYAGVPAMDIWFRRDQVKNNITIYPAYHTGFDTFYMVSEFIDPEYRIMQGCGRFAALTLKYMADSSIIPYAITKLPNTALKSLKDSPNREKLIGIYDKYIELENAFSRFLQSTESFFDNINANKLNPLQQRAINDQIMKLEQIFIIPEGLPGRPAVRNALFAPSQFDNYAQGGFPGLNDLLFGYDDLVGEEKASREYTLKRHISDLTIMADRATAFLLDVYKF